MRPLTIKRIHVNQHRLRKGEAAITIRTNKGPIYARRVRIVGPVEVIHSDKPLGCGARCWIETSGDIEIMEQT